MNSSSDQGKRHVESASSPNSWQTGKLSSFDVLILSFHFDCLVNMFSSYLIYFTYLCISQWAEIERSKQPVSSRIDNSIRDRVNFFQVALDYFTKGTFDLKAEDVAGNGHCQLLAVLMSVNATWTEEEGFYKRTSLKLFMSLLYIVIYAHSDVNIHYSKMQLV